MHQKNTIGVVITAAICVLTLGVGTAHAEANTWEDANSAHLEIRQYRFSRHAAAGFDRLVLEFERKDSSSTHPTIHSENSGAPRETIIQVDNATLLGAIPESLINDSYAQKSRFLGPVTLNMDAPKSGFSMRAALKGGATRIEAQWMNNPPRLVIDAHGKGSGTQANRDTAGSIRRTSAHPSLAELSCFPATSKVALTVIFQPQSNQYEEVQNVRVNTDGVTPQDGAPSADAINCYPKKTQILAALSFEEKPRESFISRQPLPEKSLNSPQPEKIMAQPTAPAATKQAEAGEEDLDPGPLSVPPSLGQLPIMQGTRAPAAAAPTASPLSILPPLNN